MPQQVERLPVDVMNQIQRQNYKYAHASACDIAVSMNCNMSIRPWVLFAYYPHASSMNWSCAQTDRVIPPFEWHAQSASGLHFLGIVLLCALSLANNLQRDLGNTIIWLNRGSMLELVCRVRAGSWRSTVCLCVSFRNFPVNRVHGPPQPIHWLYLPTRRKGEGITLWFD